MKEYLIRVKNGGCREAELQEMFDELSNEGWQLDHFAAAGADTWALQKFVYIFSREK